MPVMIPMQILIVEDERHVRSLLRELVEPFADTVYESGDGSDAVQQYRTHRPDLVLMDIRMPVMDGLEATRGIMAIDETASIFIVTEYANAVYKDEARKAGASGYFLKENLMDLRTAVQSIAGDHRTQIL